MSEPKIKVVIVGCGMVGFRFCEKLLEVDVLDRYEMTIIGEEAFPAYDRVALSQLFSDKDAIDLVYAMPRMYRSSGIFLQLNDRVVTVDRTEKKVVTASGKEVAYDRLIFATGARPVVPAFSGVDLDGVHVYRTVEDVQAIQRTAASAKHAVVIGGGLLGLEAAEACREKGLQTTVVERESVLMACQLDEAAGTLLDEKLEALGIHQRLGTTVQSIEGEGRVSTVRLSTGELLPAELVILAVGVTPNDELGRDAGLTMGVNGGIDINARTQTSDPDIFAIGECASISGVTFGLVAPGFQMADVAAARLAHHNKTFTLTAPTTRLKLLDLQVASLGAIDPAGVDVTTVVDQDMERGVYKKLILTANSNRLLGAILVGETSEFDRLRRAIDERIRLEGDPSDLLAPIGSPLSVEDLTLDEDDLVCFCNGVLKKDIVNAITTKGLTTTAEVMGATYAAGLCGSCYPMVDQITKETLKNPQQA